MDYAELLFAMKLREIAMERVNDLYPEMMNGPSQEQFVDENFEQFLREALYEVDTVARMAQEIRKG